MEMLQQGIRWGAAGLWKYYSRESTGERRDYGNTTEGNPLGSGGAMEILQKGVRWGAVTGMGLEMVGALTGLTPRCERGGGGGGRAGKQRGRGGKNCLMLKVFSLKPSLLGHLGTPR